MLGRRMGLSVAQIRVRQAPELELIFDNLEENPAEIQIRSTRRGTLTIDFDASATPPAKGAGSIGTLTTEVPARDVSLDYSTFSAQTGYSHLRVTSKGLDSEPLTLQQVVAPTTVKLFADIDPRIRRSITGLNVGEKAQVGSQGLMELLLPPDVTADSIFWGSTKAGDDDLGEAANPGDFAAVDDVWVLCFGSDGNVYFGFAEVEAVAPAFTQQPSITKSGGGDLVVGDTLDLPVGAADVTPVLETFTYNGADKSSEVVSNQWDTTGETVYGTTGEIRYRTSSTNAQGATLSNFATATLKAVPDAFVAGNWTATDSTTGSIDVVINALPDDGNGAITRIEYRIDSGSWISTGGTGDFSAPAATGSRNIELRAVNEIGNGAASDTKTRTVTNPNADAPVFTGPITANEDTDTLSFQSDIACTVYWARYALGSTPTASNVRNGTGTGYISGGNFSYGGGSDSDNVSFAQGTDGDQMIAVVGQVGTGDLSNLLSIDVRLQTTAPNLTSVGITEQDGRLILNWSTDTAEGTARAVVVPNGATPPTATEVRAGQASGGGTPADDSGNISVTTAGVQSAVTLSSVVNDTAYDVYLVHADAAGNEGEASVINVTPQASGGDGTTTDFVMAIEIETPGETFTLPIQGDGGTVDWDLDHGDGSVSSITSASDTGLSKTYDDAGSYSVSIGETVNFGGRIRFRNTTAATRVQSVSNLGNLGWTNTQDTFRDCADMLTFTAGVTDCAPTSMKDMFKGCDSLTEADMNGIDTSDCQFFNGVFSDCPALTSIVGLDGLDYSSAVNFEGFLTGGSMTTAQYDAFLARLQAQGASLESGETLDAGGSTYTSPSAARTYLTGTLGWTINDGGAA